MPLRSREQPERPTDTQILDVAERLVQTRGYNAFSYADIANELELTKAALHYHFAGKAQLGEALIHRYADRFRTALDALDAAGRRCGVQARWLCPPLRRCLSRRQILSVRHARR